MSRRPIIAVLALLLLGALAAVPIAAATDQTTTPLSLGVAPSKLQLRLKPGHTVRANLKIYNKGSKPVTIDVFPQDYTVDMDSNGSSSCRLARCADRRRRGRPSPRRS